MIRKVYKEGQEARKAVVKGLQFAVRQVVNTQGPSGRNAILGRAYERAELTNDGKTIADDIRLDNEIEQVGVERVQTVANATFEEGGDNTTTAVNLLGAFTSLGMEMLDVQNEFTGVTEDPIHVRNKIHEAADELCTKLETLANPVKTLEDMQKIAFAATENNAHAAMIASMFSVIGKDGVVTYEDSYDGTVSSEIVEGFEIEAGLSHEYMANKDDKTFTLDTPAILVTNKSIDFKDQITPLTRALYEQGLQDLVIVSDSFSKEALHSFLEAKVSNSFNIIAIKAPYFGKKANMEDVAIALGAKFIDRDLQQLNTVTLADLGTTKRIIVTSDKSTFLKPKGKAAERIEEIRSEIKEKKSKFDQEQLKKRLAKLSGGVGVIRIGSPTQTHTGYLKKKIMNGVNSVKSSLKGGAIKGAGLTLIELSDMLPTNILAKAIRSPYEQIQKNAGGKLLISDNILDPMLNIKAAIMTAAREAGDVLTIEFANADKYEEPKDFKDE